jgi:hypothetical protein
MGKLSEDITALVLLDYEITFKKHDEIPGQFQIILKNKNKPITHDTETCTLPYSHLSEQSISKYISHLIANLGV